MIIHKYKSILSYKALITSHCGITMPMKIRRATRGIFDDSKAVPPNNCIYDENLINCPKCIDIVVEIYKNKIAVLESIKARGICEPSPLP